MYTVKQLSSLAGISPRTLHYYDEIGLLEPAAHGDNGYRYYGEEALLRQRPGKIGEASSSTPTNL